MASPAGATTSISRSPRVSEAMPRTTTVNRHTEPHLNGSSAGCTPAPRPWLRRTARVFSALFLAQTLLAMPPAYAQLRATPGAPSGQKPLIDAAANGTPIVLIAPPSKSGVSRNQYEQFNVGPQGLILNNSTGTVQTRIGGWITGNLQLGLTPARIILNEVAGPNTSRLGGSVEVGGQRADVVIANPNGISCDGCGFLNTDRATLSTGRPQFGADNAITGLDVRQGLIHVGPGGLSATEQQQLELYARGLVVEGQINAHNLQSVIGANRVLYGAPGALPESSAHEGTGTAPRFAVDIKALGGMYAGQLYLIATEKGLGVNSVGRSATTAGNMLLSVNGDLTLKDSYSAGNTRLVSTGRTTLTGQTLATGNVAIVAPGQLVNSGALQAKTLELDTPGIDNSGSIAQTAPGRSLALVLPGGLENSGQMHTPGDLSIQAAAVTNRGAAAGRLSAGGSLQLVATSLQLTGQRLQANGNVTVQAQTLRATDTGVSAGGDVTLESQGPLDISGTTVSANGKTRVSGSETALGNARIAALGDVQITSPGAVTAHAADISSNAALSVQGSRVDMRASTLGAKQTARIRAGAEIRLDDSRLTAEQQVQLQGRGISTAGATLSADKISIDAGAARLDNQAGRIQASSAAADALTVRATGIDNQSGELRANGGLTLDARGGLLNNQEGMLTGTTGTLTNLGGLTNNGGTLHTRGDLSISGTMLDNSQGTIVTAGNLSVRTPGRAIDNTAGLLQAGGSVLLDSGSAALKNAAGTVLAGADLTVHAGTVDSAAGTLTAGGRMTVTATELQARGAKLGSGAAMDLTSSGDAQLGTAAVNAGGDLVIRSAGVQAVGATLASNGDVQIAGSSITGGNWSAQGQLTATSQGALDVTGGALLAGSKIAAQGQGITTDNAKVDSQSVTLNAGRGALSNAGGQISATATSGTALSISANGIHNAGGTLSSAADAGLNAGTQAIDNTGGKILVAGALQMQTSALLNRNGTLSTDSALNLQGMSLNNQGGTIQTRRDLHINTAGQTLDNAAGQLIAGGNATLHAATLGNASGTISAGGAAQVQATALDTTRGRISGTRQLDILVTRRLTADAATLETEGRFTAGAADVDADAARIRAGQTLSMNASGELNVRSATLAAQGAQAGDVQLSAGSIAADDARITGDAGVSLNSGGAISLGSAQLTALQTLSAQAGGTLSADAATLKTNAHLKLSGARITAVGATASAGGKTELSARTGAATLDQATVLAGDTVQVTAVGIGARGASMGAGNNATLDAASGDLTAPDLLLQSRSGAIRVHAANVNVAGSTPLVDATPPTRGLLAGQDIEVLATGAVDLSRALTNAGANVRIRAQDALTNTAGRIIAGGQASLAGAALNNQGGTVDANGALDITVGNGLVRNDQGRISTRSALSISAPTGALSSLSNVAGVIEARGALSARLQHLDNQDGRIVALAGLALSGGAMNNTGGLLASEGQLSIDTQGQAFSGDQGKLLSTQGNVTLSAGTLSLNQANVLAQGQVALTGTQATADSASFQANTGALQIDVGRGAATLDKARLLAGQDIALAAGASALNGATLTSGAHTTLSTDALQASQAQIDTQGHFSATARGAVSADRARIASGGNAGIAATQGIAVNGGSVSAQRVDLDAGSGVLNNASGNLVAHASTGTAMTLKGQGLVNDAATITANADLAIDAGAENLSNAAGKILAVGAATVRSTGLRTVDGTIAANGALTIDAAQAHANAGTDGTGGTIRSGQALTLSAGSTTLNRATLSSGTHTTLRTGALQALEARIDAQGNLSAAATGAVSAGQARIAAGGGATLGATRGIDVHHASVSAQTIDLDAGSGVLDNTAGNLSAAATTGTAIRLQSQGLRNDGATIASAADLSANAGAGEIRNAAGSILAVGAADVRSTGLHNAGGTIAANGALVLNAAQANAATRTDNRRGTIRSAQSSLELSTGELLNSRDNGSDAGSVISAATDLRITATGPVDNSRSDISGGNDVRIAATGAVANAQGRIAAGRDASVTAHALDNRSGAIIGTRDTSATAGVGGVANDNGTIQAGKNLTLASAGAVDNTSGQLTAAQQLDLRSAALTNTRGRISAQTGAATLTVSSYTGHAASTVAGAALSLDTQGGALTATGSTFGSGAGMLLRAGAAQLDDASIRSGAALDARTTGLQANRADVQAAGPLSADAGTGAFDAASSHWRSEQSVALNGVAFVLTDATASANQSVAVTGTRIDATRARITSLGDVSVVASNGALHLGNAHLRAGQDLTATGTGAGTTAGMQALAGRDLTLGQGAHFDFAAQEYQFGRDLTVRSQGMSTAGRRITARNLTLDAGSGELHNQGATLQATGDASVRGTGVNNQDGVIAANGQATVSAGSGILNNAGGQTYSTQGALSLSGGSIANASGTVSAATDVTISGGSLDNAGRSIVAGRNLTAQLSGSVNNAGGRLIANTGAASITAEGIDNRSATISGATRTTAQAGSGSLLNTSGQITGQNVHVGGAVHNSAGVISGSHSVSMSTLDLDNDAGVIESGAGGIRIDTQGHALKNTRSGSTRGIVSQGSIHVAAGVIDNQAGYVGANGGLHVTQSSSIDNRGGTLLGQGNSSVSTRGTLNNQGGSILSGADLDVRTGTVDNSHSGTIYAAQDLSVSATSIDNSHTKNGSYTTGLLAGGSADISAATIDNAHGAIVSLRETAVQASRSLDNTQGQIAGDSVTMDTPVLTNTAGRVDAQQRMTLKVARLGTDGVLASNGAMDLQLQGDYVNTGTVSSNGKLSISTTGSYTNQGRVSTRDDLSLSAQSIDNQSGATIDSRTTTLSARANVNNQGLINSTDGLTRITAAVVNNTGRIYGDGIAITGATHNSAGAGGGAVIASRGGDVTLHGALHNTDGAQLFSLGSIQINGAARNHGSTINAMRNVAITGTLSNTNADLRTGTQMRSEVVSELYITPEHDTTRYNASELDWTASKAGTYVLPSRTYPADTFGSLWIRPGGQQTCSNILDPCTSSFLYSDDDPIWTRFGIASPSTLAQPVLPTGLSILDRGCTSTSGGEQGRTERTTYGPCGAYWESVDARARAVAAKQVQLDASIEAFNSNLETRSVANWYETRITGRTINETSVESSKPGYVLAGGNISLNGGTNSDSVIIAGGSVDAAGVNNRASAGTRVTTSIGTMVFSRRKHHGGLTGLFGNEHSREVSAPQPIPDASVTQSFNLPIVQLQSHGSPQTPTRGGTSTPVGGATASVPDVGASASAARRVNPADAVTDATRGGTLSADAGAAPQVQTTTTTRAPGAPDVAGTLIARGAAVNVETGQRPDAQTPAVAANAGTRPRSTTTNSLTASLDAAPQAALPGSVLAAGLRAGQLAAITTSLTRFADAAKVQPIQAAAVDTTSARRTGPAQIKAAGYTTVMATGAVRAPDNQLFTLNHLPRAALVETDPAFTNYRTWISSAYMLTQLSINPERNLKLYGDGFAEQRLIDDQIMALTGRRFLSNYQSTEDEYQDLLDAGVMFAQRYQLSPGVALSAEQMALLTTDIVWLQARETHLPDGSTVQTLVPTVYLRRPVAGDLTPTGALIAGANVSVRSPGDLSNTGTILATGDALAGDGRLTISGRNVVNTGTLAGNAISVDAQQTLDNAGGVVQGLGASSHIAFNARDVILRTTTQTSAREIAGPNGSSTGTHTNVDRVATLSADSVRLAARNNIDLRGASVQASGDLVATAGGAITSHALQTGYALNVPLGQGGAQGRSSQYHSAATTQQLTTLNAGQALSITAAGDAHFSGTNASAGTDLTVQARNISIEAAKNSLTIDQQNARKDAYHRIAQTNETLVGGAFTAGRNATLIANGAKADGQGNVTAVGATIAAGTGQASLIANNDVTVQNATTGHGQASESYDRRSGLFSNKSTQRAEGSQSTRVAGSSITGNTVLLRAGNDVTLQASQINATSDAYISAGRDVNVTTAQESSSASSLFEQNRRGLSANLGQISVGKSAQKQTQALQSTTQVGSTISGANVAITAGRDATFVASTVLADQDVAVRAGRNILLYTATDTENSQTQAQSSATVIGLAPTGLSGRFTMFGKNSASQAGRGTSTREHTSGLSATGGNLTLTAGTDAQYKGTGQGNVIGQGAVLLAKDRVSVTGNAVDLQATQDTSHSAMDSRSRSVTAGSQLAGALGTAVTMIGDRVTGADNTSSSNRLQAAQTLKAGYDAYKLANIVQQQGAAALTDTSAGIGVSATLSVTKSEEHASRSDSTSRGSSVQAARMDITSREGDLRARGAKLQAQDITLDAAKKLDLGAATNSTQQQSKNKSSGLGMGVTLGVGEQTGISFQLNAGQSRGQANGSEITYDNTQVLASNHLHVRSGGDTDIRGAQLAGHRVTTDIQGKLLIETLQDQSQYQSQQSSSGVNVSVCVPPLCYGVPVTGSVSASKTTVDHNYQSATGQSGIAAGDGGYDIRVKGATELRGGAITSTAPSGKNHLQTESLRFTDLDNKQDTRANADSISLGYGGAGAIATIAGNAASNILGSSAAKAGLPDSGSARSQTQSVISPGQVTFTGEDPDGSSAQALATLTARDPSTANQSLKNNLTLVQAQDIAKNQQKAQDDIRAAGIIGSMGAQAIGDIAQKNGWVEGSAQKVLLHGALGAGLALVGGGNAGAGFVSGAVNELAVGAMASYLEANGIPRGSEEHRQLMLASSAALGTVVGKATGGTATDVALSGQTAKGATENNYLNHLELSERARKQRECRGGSADACQAVKALDAVSVSRNAAVRDELFATSTEQLALGQQRTQFSISVEQAHQIQDDLGKTMAGLATLKDAWQTELSGTTDARKRTDLSLQIKTADNHIRQIATLGKDNLQLLYAKTGDPDYLKRNLVLEKATNGDELAAALGGGMSAMPGRPIFGGKAPNRAAMSAAAESPSYGQRTPGYGKTTSDAQGSPLSTAGATPNTSTPAPTNTTGNTTVTGNAAAPATSAKGESPNYGQQISGYGKTTHTDAQGNPLPTAGTPNTSTPTTRTPSDNTTVTFKDPVIATGNAAATDAKTIALATQYGYKFNSDGTYTGPNKGPLTHVGTAADGVTPVFQRPGGEYFTLNSAGKQETVLRGDTGNGIQWKKPIGGGSQVEQNRIAGREFQDASSQASGFPENFKGVPVTLPDGRRVTTIPDHMAKTFGIVETKHAVSLSMSDQFRAQLLSANKKKIPYTLVVSPSNKVISENLWNAIHKIKGAVYQFDKETGIYTLISKRPQK
ncbi:filamentous hemagglutinin N-terminal domain-containing protein [Verminephrobacter aporrectodeae subsp. tuberculatae]|nr:filamentous hemagglutinin N-terminal domain-containing protein [Verminephrobacter aporrectodeae subsp. tuberculatae]